MSNIVKPVNPLLRDMLDGVPEIVVKAADSFAELFADRPVSDSVDHGVYGVKLAMHFNAIRPTKAEMRDAYLRLEASCQFRPTISEILAVFESIRAEASEADRRAMWSSPVEMVDAHGVPVLVPKSLVQQALDDGLVMPPAPKPRSMEEAKAVLEGGIDVLVNHMQGKEEQP